ncbi:hypothetical protein MK139_07165 [bacterium]|nr:hypothetical protein [bacterium]
MARISPRCVHFDPYKREGSNVCSDVLVFGESGSPDGEYRGEITMIPLRKDWQT